MAIKMKVKKTDFVDVNGNRIYKHVGGKHFIRKVIKGKRVNVQANKAAKRADGRNIANMSTVPAAIRNKNM
jgi:uncharacterized protein (DUF39 family)